MNQTGIQRRVYLTLLCFACAAILNCFGGPAALAQTSDRTPDIVLRGTLSGDDHQSYREVAFRVPNGVRRLIVDFTYSGHEAHTTLDIGLRDPQRFRGWSGGNKARFMIEDALATPSYLPGPLPSGVWALIIGVPNIRKAATSEYQARVWFDADNSEFPGFMDQAKPGAGAWYRGDLHAHTAHSDGTCLSHHGLRTPCPVFRTLEAAVHRKLDFLAITDHNTVSQNHALQELAPYFDDLLILPGEEITTFKGHANVWGVTQAINFQVTPKKVKSFDRIVDQAHAAHGLVSINHPKLPSGEACMGCGWTAQTDWSKIDAIEVVNGGSLAILGPEGPMSGIPFWEGLLDQGYRITAVGGSDNHDPDLAADKPGALGRPTTFVHSTALSQSAILEAIRRGRAFIDIAGLANPRLEVEARSGDISVEMGGVLELNSADHVSITVNTSGLPDGARISVRGSGSENLSQKDWPASMVVGPLTLAYSGRPSWVRFDVRDAKGALILLGNPIYLRSAPRP